MTEKRFKIGRNALGMKFICYDGKFILMGTFADTDGLKEVVDLLNEQEETIKRLKEIREEQIQTILKQKRKIKELEQELQNLQTFKKVLEFAEKDMEERADWQAYCEKEFEGL